MGLDKLSAKALFRVLLITLTTPQCFAAVSNYWNVVDCGNVAIPGGHTIDDLYNNALDMASYAQTRLDVAINAPRIEPDTDTARAANNAKWLWNVQFQFARKILGIWTGDPLDSS